MSNSVYAAVPTTFSQEAQDNALINVRNKLLYKIIAQCYDVLSEEIEVTSGYLTWSQIFSNGNSKFNLPYYIFENASVKSSTKMTCSEIMGGWKNFWGTQTFPGVGYKSGDVPVVQDGKFGTKEQAIKFLETIGYSPTEQSANEVDGYRCLGYAGTTQGGNKIYATDKLCAKQDANDANLIDLSYGLRVDDISSSDLGDGNLDTMIFKIKSVEYSSGTLKIPKVGYDSWIFTKVDAIHAHTDNYASCTSTFAAPIIWDTPAKYSYCYKYGVFNLSTGRLRVSEITSMSYNDLGRALASAILTAKAAEPDNFPPTDDLVPGSSAYSIDPALASYLKKGSFKDYMKYFLGDNYEKYNADLTETEKYILYWSGLKEVVKADAGAPNGNVKYWLTGTEFKDDYNLTCSSGCDIVTLDASGNMKTLKAISGSTPTVLSLINGLNFDSDDFGEVEEPDEDLEGIVTDIDPGAGEDYEVDVCYKGAGVLGWILCPVISGLSDLGKNVYDWVEDNFLQVRASIFSDPANGVMSAWEKIRNFANIAFIIIFLIVIFSQITGIGIDNYGIKRILPKVIIGAIIMNLSYVICELAIDASNIVGSGLKTTLTGLAPDVSLSATAYEPSGPHSVAIIGGGAVGAAVFMILSQGFIGALLLLLVALITLVIAILVLFVILVARQAGIVICVVVAPIAVLCYLLPNTERLYKKWFDLFKGLLIIYPICGLVVGAGDFMSRIFGNLASGETDSLQLGFALGAMVVQVIPYLFIPTLLKSSLAAMGNLGARISSLGNAASGKLGGKIKNSDSMKMSQQHANDARMMRKAGYSEKRGGLTTIGKAKARFAKTKVGGIIGYTRMQNARVQNAEKIADMNSEAAASLTAETAAADIAASNMSTNDYFESQIASAGGDIRKLDAAILAAQKRGVKNKDIAAMIRRTANNGKLQFANNTSRSNWMNSMLQKHGDIMSTDYDLQEWARDGGVDKSGKAVSLGGYGEYMRAHRSISDIDISDLSKMSGNSLAGAVKAGLVSSSMAQQYLASNPNQSVDKKIMMGAVASGIVDASSLSGVDAEQFKQDAESLAVDENAAADTIRTGYNNSGRTESLSGLVDSWTSTSQVRAYVSQDSSAMRPGQMQKDPVRVVNENNASFDIRGLGDETLLDIATNPHAHNNDPTRVAAEQEFLRRNPDFNGGNNGKNNSGQSK